MSAFHHLVAPSRWVTSLDTLSYSSLCAIERCPRQWQLTRSEWPGFERLPVHPNASAIEGTLVHEVLDLVFREMAFAGLPEIGATGFREALRRADVMGQIQRRLDAAHATLERHPRRASLHLPHDARSLYNRVAGLFQREYAAVERNDAAPLPRTGAAPGVERSALSLLTARSVLTEWSLAHPTLPLRGVADLIRREASGTMIVDFKTGQPRDEHETQLALYALLWWRTTGDLPRATAVRHPRGLRVFPVDAESLVEGERALATRIDALRGAVQQTPAFAKRGAHCGSCPVRPFCEDYWAEGAQASTRDVELRVPSEIESNGFVAGLGRRRLPVVWDDDGAAVHGPFVPGEVVRIIGAIAHGEGLRLSTHTEVFHRGDGATS